MRTVAKLLSILLLASAAAFCASESVLYNFKGGDDGGTPRAGVVMDKDGNLYGITSHGGKGGVAQCFGSGCGFVYKLSRASNSSWNKTNLYSFTGLSDGGVPVGRLAMDAQGNLYGVTEQGGTGPCDSVLGGGCGVIFRLKRRSNGTFAYSVLHNFDPAKVLDDGAYSNSGVAFGPNGSLFGATTFGGDFACDCGIVYQLTQGANDEWHEKILYVFVGVSRGGNDVSFPESGVVFDADGNIFGTTPGGGDFSCNFGCGGVYELIANGDGTYTEKVLHIFSGGTSDGMGGEAEPLLDDKGNLFGTTANGGGTGCQNGGFGCGTVFQMRKSSGEFKERVILHLNGKNGYAPFGNLTLVGNDLFGTTEGGGQTNQGIVFRLTNVSGKWQETVLHHFGQGQDGSDPEAGLISDGNGGFYGTTRGGGTGGQGTVYHITP